MGKHLTMAVKQLEHDITRLENGILDVVKLIGEKREQLTALCLLVEKSHEEAGNEERKPFKTS